MFLMKWVAMYHHFNQLPWDKIKIKLQINRFWRKLKDHWFEFLKTFFETLVPNFSWETKLKQRSSSYANKFLSQPKAITKRAENMKPNNNINSLYKQECILSCVLFFLVWLMYRIIFSNPLKSSFFFIHLIYEVWHWWHSSTSSPTRLSQTVSKSHREPNQPQVNHSSRRKHHTAPPPLPRKYKIYLNTN